MTYLLNRAFSILSPASIVIGRTLLGLYFVLPGIFKFLSWDMHVAMMQKHGMVFIPVLLVTAALVEIVAGLGIIFNRYAALCALVLAVTVVLINVNLHDFWNVPSEQQNFVKNTAIFGSLLLFSGLSWKAQQIKSRF